MPKTKTLSGLLFFLGAFAVHAAIEDFKLPEGFVIERVAGPPGVERPMLANFDDHGRLYVADSIGVNLTGAELLKNPPHKIRRLEAADGHGLFDKSTVFADQLVFPQGVLWYDGSVYAASPPNFWRFQDTDGDGVADKREILASGFTLTGVSDDTHGASLGPDGRIYWFAGRLPHEIKDRNGALLHKGSSPLMLRCKPDGSELEIVCGVHGNCVGAAFTPEGEPFACGTFFGTMGIGLRDAIIHCVDGAEYPVLDSRSEGEHKRTGELMPALTQFGVAAASGMTIYRDGQFGTNFSGNLFSAHFNLHKIVRHVLERDGATFKCRNEDFLVSTNPDFHPTDVLEDADGSLLVVDTGGWFRIGCPTSQISKPDIQGAIYRIRRQGTPSITDPRGLKINWTSLPPAELAIFLSDPRFAVREHAIQQLANLKTASIRALAETLQKSASTEARRNALWALTRMDSTQAREVARIGLNDPDAGVRQTAARSVGLHRDAKAAPRLMELVRTETPPVRREAATSLGRIRTAEAVPALLGGLHASPDRFLEHALIFALIQINDPAATAKGLSATNSEVRRGALIALDQMDNGNLKPEMAMPFLDPADPLMQQTALWVVAHHPDWGKSMLGFFEGWVAREHFDEKDGEVLKRQLLAFCKDPEIQRFVAQHLRDEKTPVAARLVLLETIAQAPLNKLPVIWGAELKSQLTNTDARIVRQTVATIRSVPAPKKPALKRIDRRIDFIGSEKGFGETPFRDNFSARWTGFIKIPAAGDYKFLTTSDDGSRLFIDGKQVVENGGFHAMKTEEGMVALQPGEHEIKIEFYQGGNKSGCKVSWKPRDAAEEIIPAEVLFHRRDPEAHSALEPGLTGEYFDMNSEGPGWPVFNAVRFDAPLLQIASNPSNSDELRVEALAAAAPYLAKIKMELVTFLLARIEAGNPPLVRMTAAGALGQLPLDQAQLLALADNLPKAGALEMSKLLAAYSREGQIEVGNHLLAALEQAPALESVRADDLRQVLKNYPPEVRERAAPLLKRLSVDLEKQKARLEELKPVLAGGEAPRGRELFFGKATCFACHSVQGRGGRVGPDLSKIGAIRAGPDLLEAVVFPSASFARGFEPFLIITKDGEAHSGIISRETADAIYFYDSARIETRVPRSQISEIRQGTVSVMPEGLEAQLTRQELGDVIAFLSSLR